MLSNQRLLRLLHPDREGGPLVRRLDARLIGARTDSPLQPASIDLHVGKILVPADHEVQGSKSHDEETEAHDDWYIVPSGGSVVLLTHEEINFSSEYAGLMFPKSSKLAERGVLLTNFGHVDPGYQGKLRYALINMGSQGFPIRCGDPITTLCVFHLNPHASPDYAAMRKDEDIEYRDAQRNKKFTNYLSSKLLSIGRITTEAKRVAREIVVEQGLIALMISNVIAFLVGVATVAITFAALWLTVFEPRIEKIEARIEQGQVSAVKALTTQRPRLIVPQELPAQPPPRQTARPRS